LPKASDVKPACFKDSLGDGATCETQATWKERAWAACQAKGMALADYAVESPCGADGFRVVRYACCTQQPLPTRPPPPPIQPPPPQTCFTDLQGSDSSCKTPDTWKAYAAEACKQKGTELTFADYGTPCGAGLFRYVKYQCCSPFDSCAGKVCGDVCTLCPPNATGCVETKDLKRCDAAGKCASSAMVTCK
jgi:hypothetical protein